MSGNNLTVVLLLAVVALASFFVGRLSVSKQDALVSYKTSDDPADQLHQRFGWGKAPDVLEIEAADVIRGSFASGNLMAPALKLAIRNNGPSDLNSFGINYSFTDISNKRIIWTAGMASGAIRSGWTSTSKLIHVQPEKCVDYPGGSFPIDFYVEAVVWVNTKSDRKELYRTVFDPGEIITLPRVSF